MACRMARQQATRIWPNFSRILGTTRELRSKHAPALASPAGHFRLLWRPVAMPWLPPLRRLHRQSLGQPTNQPGAISTLLWRVSRRPSWTVRRSLVHGSTRGFSLPAWRTRQRRCRAASLPVNCVGSCLQTILLTPPPLHRNWPASGAPVRASGFLSHRCRSAPLGVPTEPVLMGTGQGCRVIRSAGMASDLIGVNLFGL
jgi:hypothetical protein